MSCGCSSSGDKNHSCGTKINGCSSVDTCGNSYKLSVFDWLSGFKNPSLKDEEKIVEVRFKNDRKAFFKNTNNLPLHIGSVVVTETGSGHDVGVVSLTGDLVGIQMKKKKFPKEQILKIYRIATQKDIEIWQEARKKEASVRKDAKIIASTLKLDMKITDVEFQGDGTKATFYYTADSRVDFRQLIKDFAIAFRTKIDMKQIGFRQEAAKIGGIGSCGRELCCSSWLTDFRSVNTNAARYQQLSINPQKLAGQCGKLKCCLNFELDSYLDALSDFPPANAVIDTEKGKAFCIKIDVFKKKMWFAYSENPLGWYDLEVAKVKKFLQENKKGNKVPPLEEMMSNQTLFDKPVDLIQENKVDRFERKKGNRKGKNREQRPEKREAKNIKEPRGEKPMPKTTEKREPRNKKQEPRGEKREANAENTKPKSPNKKNFKKQPFKKPQSPNE